MFKNIRPYIPTDMNIPLLLILSLAHLTTDLAQGALPIILPFLKETFNLNYTQVSLTFLVFNIMSSIIQPLFGLYCDKVSARWLLPTGVFLAGTGIALAGVSPSYFLVLSAIALSGLGVAAFHPEACKRTNQASGVNKGTGFSLFSIGGNLGFALGALFMTFLLTTPGGLSNTVYFLSPALILTLLLWHFLPQLKAGGQNPPEKTTKTAPLWTTVWQLPLLILLVIVFIRTTILSGLTAYIPLYYVSHLKNDPTYASILVSVFLLSGVIGTFAGGILSDRFGRVRVIFLSMLVMLPLLYAFTHSSGSISAFFLFLSGGALVAATTSSIVLAQELVPHNVGMASGLVIGLSVGLGGAGVTMLGVIADRWGVPAVFPVINVLPALAALLTYFLPKDH